jgi:raffinose/stachyose/melibiose transport system permease protein
LKKDRDVVMVKDLVFGQTMARGIMKNGVFYLLLVPTFALLLIFSYWPAFSALFHSLFIWDGVHYQKFVGIANFLKMAKDPIFISSLKHMIFLAVMRGIMWVFFPWLTAELVFHLKSKMAQYVYRILFIIPMIIPEIVLILVWQYLYASDGPINGLLQTMGLGSLARAWLGDFNYAIWAVLFVGFPFILPFYFLIFLAGLMSTSPAVFEAASLDGATGFKRVFLIEIPLLVGQIKLTLILTLIASLQGYQRILVLTRGGPGWATMVPGLYMYQSAFTYHRMGYGCAVGTVIFLFVLILTILNMKYIRSQE